ncbi:MAG: hypothetical protein NC213_03810 [Acetobacter sp.]|nr:hypothetical protein [Bacteroides sp.]MCM1340848.1 hypothetical protein [Acetobacter sp.]MCM1432595.1 hypothetical protein [Clostridiales bacterium]
MEQFIKYIDGQLPSKPGNDLLFKFKRKTLEEMNGRYAEVMTRGISNQKVISDLIISEHPDLMKEFAKYEAEEKTKIRDKRKTILNIAGSVIYILCLLVFYLGISFLTQKWGQTWLIIVDGILIWVAYLLTLAIKKITTLKKIFFIFARILMAIEVMVITVAVFLFCLVMFNLSHSWLIVISGIALMFVADAVFALYTKQKLAIINVLGYMPVVATMLYIILSAAGILAWNTGWLLIIMSLVLDFIIIAASIGRNKHYKQEVIDTWKES